MEPVKKVKTIPISGITRNTPDETTEDGGLLEAINLRHRDGAWKGVHDKEVTGFQTQQADVYGVPYHHPVLPANMYVQHNVTDNTIDTILFDETDNNTPVVQLTLANGEVFNRFSHMNNTLLVFTSVKKYLLYWNKDTSLYVDLTFLPIPTIKVYDFYDPESKVITAVGPDMNGTSYVDYGFTTLLNWNEQFRLGVVGDYLKYKADQNKIKLVEGFVMIRVAYRLFDGNYILASQPHLHHIGYHATKQPILTVLDEAPSAAFSPAIQQNYFNLPVLHYNFFNTGLFTLPDHDKMGVVESMDIFSTRIVEAYDYIKPITDWTDVGQLGTISYFNPPFNIDQLEEMIETGQYYKIESIPIKEIIKQAEHNDTSGLYYYAKADNRILDYSKEVSANELLAPDNFTHHQYNSLADYTYNSRIHLGNIINKLSGCLDNTFLSDVLITIGPGKNGYAQSLNTFPLANMRTKFLGTFDEAIEPPNTAQKIYCQAWLNTYEGRKIVTTEISSDFVSQFDAHNIPDAFSYYLYTNGSTRALFLNPVISYPDYRAYKLRYFYTYGGVKYFLQDFELKPNIGLNTASYVSPLVITDGSTGNYYPIKIDLPATTGTTMPTDDPATDDVITDTNRMQVSEQSNPFFWPAQNSYRFGLNENEIIAISGVQSAMSDSAFGQYPLYAFTKSGVYTVQTGNGEVLYQSIQHINNEILLKRYSLISITGAIAFACKEGIRLLQGSQVTELSMPVEGSVYNPLSSKPLFLDAISGFKIPNISQYLSNITFSAYIADCIMLYDVENKELIISSLASGINYSYVFSFYTKSWSTRTEVFTGSMIVNGRMIGIKQVDDTAGDPKATLTINKTCTDHPEESRAFRISITKSFGVPRYYDIVQGTPLVIDDIPYGTYAIAEVDSLDYDISVIAPESVTIDAENTDITVEITNSIIPVLGKVTVTLAITGVETDETYFDITITGTDGEMVEQSGQVRIGEPLTFEDLPFGTYEIAESAVDGYTLTSITPSTVVLSEENTVESVVIVNEVSLTPIKYGALYHQTAASKNGGSGVGSIAPDGWHVPTSAEWVEFWGAFDVPSNLNYFNRMLCGDRGAWNGSFNGIDTIGIFASSSAFTCYVYSPDYPYYYGNDLAGYGVSARCIKNTSDWTEGETVTDIDGNIYPTTKIGNQVWMAANLAVTKYNDGTPIPNVTDNAAWAALTTGAYCWYDNDINNK